MATTFVKDFKDKYGYNFSIYHDEILDQYIADHPKRSTVYGNNLEELEYLLS